MSIRLICLDADDTLWHNMRFFNQAHDDLFTLLNEFADSKRVRRRLEATQRRNQQLYGFGAKSYTLSAIETAIEVAGDELPIATVRELLASGRNLLSHPLELFPGAAEGVAQLAERAPVVLVTKGDLLHQQAKVAASGIGSLLTGVEVVSDKTLDVFLKIFERYRAEPASVLVAGDSVRSDIGPALQAGAYAALVPNDEAWVLEKADMPFGHPRFRRVANLQDVVTWTDELRLDDRLHQPHSHAI